MHLTIFKWLSWLSAITVVLLAMVFVGASVGIIELIVTLVLAGLILGAGMDYPLCAERQEKKSRVMNG